MKSMEIKYRLLANVTDQGNSVLGVIAPSNLSTMVLGESFKIKLLRAPATPRTFSISQITELVLENRTGSLRCIPPCNGGMRHDDETTVCG